MTHKAGFINIVGLPNVGKSTLMNALLQENLSIITPKAQTTRQRINGFVNEEDYQIIYCDTPGYINQPAYEMQNAMNKFVHQAFEDADGILLVTDKFQQKEDQSYLIDQINKSALPAFIVFNKIDLCKPEEVNKFFELWKEWIPKAKFVPVTASLNQNIGTIHAAVKEILPESPAYFDKEDISDKQLRFFVSEMVREKIFLYYDKEIPYSCQVVVDSYQETEKLDRIFCNIFVERESQKAIIIGKDGSALTKVGSDARVAIEKFLGKKVFLKLFVKVNPNWRNAATQLKKFGFDI
jgi:GTP-binding protein Era